MKKVIVASFYPGDRTIENNGRIHRYFSDERRGFRESRLWHPVIIGYKTFNSLMKHSGPLPHRTNIIISRNPGFLAPFSHPVCPSLEEALKLAESMDDKVFIAGGESLYRQVMPIADRLEITEVHRRINGKTHFPEINPMEWMETYRELMGAYSFVTYIRKTTS